MPERGSGYGELVSRGHLKKAAWLCQAGTAKYAWSEMRFEMCLVPTCFKAFAELIDCIATVPFSCVPVG